jgi:hypothetical protein
LFARAEGRDNVRRDLERLSQQVMFRFDPGKPDGCLDVLQDFNARLRGRIEGSMTSAYGGGDGSQRRAANHGTEADIDVSIKIGEMVLRKLRDWTGLHEFLTQQGYGELCAVEHVEQPERICGVCRDERIREIDIRLLVDRHTAKQVETWSAETGARVPRSSLSLHFRHRRSDMAAREDQTAERAKDFSPAGTKIPPVKSPRTTT